MAEIRPEEQREKAESCEDNSCILKLQYKLPTPTNTTAPTSHSPSLSSQILVQKGVMWPCGSDIRHGITRLPGRIPLGRYPGILLPPHLPAPPPHTPLSLPRHAQCNQGVCMLDLIKHTRKGLVFLYMLFSGTGAIKRPEFRNLFLNPVP